MVTIKTKPKWVGAVTEEVGETHIQDVQGEIVKEAARHLLMVNAMLEAAAVRKGAHLRKQEDGCDSSVDNVDDDADTHSDGSVDRMKDQAGCGASVIEVEASASASAWETPWNLHGHHQQNLCPPYFLHFHLVPLL